MQHQAPSVREPLRLPPHILVEELAAEEVDPKIPMSLDPQISLQTATKTAACEGYLGIEVHWDLWIHLFRGELFVENVRGQPKRFVRTGGLMLHLRPSRKNLYISKKMTTNNAGWTRGWFYLHNFSSKLPVFINRVLRERPEKWDWGVSPPAQQAKLKVLTGALERLDQRGLMAAAVITNFHRQRVIPLMERVLPIFKLTPGARASGSRTSIELLPWDIAAWALEPGFGGSRGSLEDQDAPRAGVHFFGESRFRIRCCLVLFLSLPPDFDLVVFCRG